MNRFGLVYLVVYISKILFGRLDFVDSVLYFWFSKFGAIDLVWYIWFSPQRTNLVWYIGSGKLGLVAS